MYAIRSYYDRDDRSIAAVGAVQGEGRRGGLGADQRVDHDDPGITFDEADVRQIQTTYLVDALDVV